MQNLRAEVTQFLKNNQVTSGSHQYTRPAAQTYPHQWLWDSCLHAHIYCTLQDFEAAQHELRSLFRAQVATGADAGRIPHMTFFGGTVDEAKQDEAAHAQFDRDARLWQNNDASSITQPPIIADAVMATNNKEFWRELWQPLCAYYDWWLRRRDPDGDALYSIWHTWESGADATPRADAACLRLLESGKTYRYLFDATVNPSAKKSPHLLKARFLTIEALQEIDRAEEVGKMSAQKAQMERVRILGLEAVDIQAYLFQNLKVMAEMGRQLGFEQEAEGYLKAAKRIAKAVNEKLWDEQAGFYFDRWGEDELSIPCYTFAGFIPLYAEGLVPEARAYRLLDHLRNPKEFRARWPVPSVAMIEDSFDPDEYWRGSTWININWFIIRGLLQSHRSFGGESWLRIARLIVERSLELVHGSGFREFYRSHDREQTIPLGFGAKEYGWSGLVVFFEEWLKQEMGQIVWSNRQR